VLCQKQQMKRLFEVETVFEASGRGCVIIPTLPADEDYKIRLKDQICLYTPDGRVFDTYIAGIEFAYGLKEDGSRGCRMAIVLPRDVQSKTFH